MSNPYWCFEISNVPIDLDVLIVQSETVQMAWHHAHQVLSNHWCFQPWPAAKIKGRRHPESDAFMAPYTLKGEGE